MKIKEALGKISADPKKITLAVLALATALCLDFYLILGWQLRSVRNTKSDIMKLKSDIASLIKDTAVLEDLKNKQAGGAAKPKKLIASGDIPDFLEYVSLAADKQGLRVMQIKPSYEPKALTQKNPQSPSKAQPVLVRLELYSNYHSLGKFINALENSDYFVALDALKISPSSKDYLLEDAQMTLRTYVKN